MGLLEFQLVVRQLLEHRGERGTVQLELNSTVWPEREKGMNYVHQRACLALYLFLTSPNCLELALRLLLMIELVID
jgi:hypothetical protein